MKNEAMVHIANEDLELLIQSAPKAVNGAPTSEQIKQRKEFKEQVKTFVASHPPGSGFSYNSVMKIIKTRQESPQKVSSTVEASKSKKRTQKRAVRRSDGTTPTNAAPVDYICVLNFEATSNDGPPPRPQEIIEFSSLLINVKTREIDDTFHHYVKPDVHPELSPFCTDLTGTAQDTIDGRIPLEKALVCIGSG